MAWTVLARVRTAAILLPGLLFACDSAHRAAADSAPPDAAAADAAPESGEICGNGLDDNDSGDIDEGCPCRAGESQSCYPGDPELIGIGECAAGTQRCVDTGGEPRWGECEGAVLPADEVCDGLDTDCDGLSDVESGVCQPVTVRVEAVIDGRSRIRLSGTTSQWHHLDAAAPGRHDGDDLPTVINDVEWFPTWPASGENRDCDCLSDQFDGVNPALPPVEVETELRTIRARSSVEIIQEPSADNDHTLIVELNDLGPGGSDTYIFEADLVPVDSASPE